MIQLPWMIGLGFASLCGVIALSASGRTEAAAPAARGGYLSVDSGCVGCLGVDGVPGFDANENGTIAISAYVIDGLCAPSTSGCATGPCEVQVIADYSLYPSPTCFRYRLTAQTAHGTVTLSSGCVAGEGYIEDFDTLDCGEIHTYTFKIADLSASTEGQCTHCIP